MSARLRDGRASLLQDAALQGRSWCAAWTSMVDDAFAALLAEAGPAADDVCLLAVGGYGRQELCPGSDVDVVLVHSGRSDFDVVAVAERLWYPLWDAGLKVGHMVHTPKEILAQAREDLDTATTLLSARVVAGSAALGQEVALGAQERWRDGATRWLRLLSEQSKERHRRAGEVAFLLEPDLKDGRGGLRDVHAFGWIAASRRFLLPDDDAASVADAHETLLTVRVALHRRTGRAGDVLLLQEQDGVADDLGDPSADALMARVARAARSIAWNSDEAWSRIESGLVGPAGSSPERALGPGLVLRDGVVELAAGAEPRMDPTLPLRAGAAAASQSCRIGRRALATLAADAGPLPVPWPASAREALVEILAAGRPGTVVLETLDQHGLLERALPEWSAVRCKPQRNAYHTFTVDRHLCETAAEAARLAGKVARPDLLVLGAWLHDIGKGFPGDHTEVGEVKVQEIGDRIGLEQDDIETLKTMVRHHLLLPDAATRRDLDDPATITMVADAVGDVMTLRLLHALTEADSLSTGPAAWGTWKAGLVTDLVVRTARFLGDEEDDEDTVDEDLEAADALATQARDTGQAVISVAPSEAGEGEVWVSLAAPDRPGLFCRVAGALALHGLDVLEARAWTLGGGMAVERIRCSTGPRTGHDVVDVVAGIGDSVRAALAGRISLEARLAKRAAAYAPARRATAASPARTSVALDNRASENSTVIDVRAPDGVGVLYRITRAIADMDLDIRHAKVSTLGHEVLDAFYVVDRSGAKVTDEGYLAEIEAAILVELSRL